MLPWSGSLVGFEVLVEKIDERGIGAVRSWERDEYIGEPKLYINGSYIDSRIAVPLLEKIKSSLTTASSMHAFITPW